MIYNYLLIALRSLLKNRLFSFINIFGLALSMSVCMLVITRIWDNFSYDKFHPYADRTYRIISRIENQEGNRWRFATSPLPLREEVSKDKEILEQIVNFYPAINGTATDSVKEFPIRGAFSQPEFFKMFGFSLLHGDVHNALLKPNSIVLTYETSEKFFKDRNPVGKVLIFKDIGSFEVTGVLNKLQGKSHLNFDAYASWSSVTQLELLNKLPKKTTNWDTFENSYTYILLPEGSSNDAIKHRLDAISHEINKHSESGVFGFELQRLSSITPSPSDLYHETGRGGSWGKILAEIGIAFIILIAACFNYTNLSLARALTRGKEVGIRKLSGAVRTQVFIQYIIESVVVALLALMIGYVMLTLMQESQVFNDGYEMVPGVQITLSILIAFILFAVFAGVLAGAMPAWILSSFKPANVLRNIGSHRIMGGISLRKALMVFQFSISLVVMIFLTVFYKQFSFMQTAPVGFARENIIDIPLHGKHEQIINAITEVSGVENTGLISHLPGKRSQGEIFISTTPSDKRPVGAYVFKANQGAVEILDLRFLAGRNFSDHKVQLNQIIINEKGSQELGFKTPEEAVGMKVFSRDSTVLQIIGVVANFFDRGVGNPIRPVVMKQDPNNYGHVLVKAKHKTNELPKRLERAWRTVMKEEAFVSSWIDDDLREWHNPASSVSVLGFLAFITITIATMGLLGLVVYTVETKRKEISIRKIVGATAAQVTYLLSKGFTSLLMVSGLIALPVGYVLSEMFLYNFTNRISIGIETLITCFGILLVIGLTTILSQTYQAAQENPAGNLRSE